jgi:hypothetical protein
MVTSSIQGAVIQALNTAEPSSIAEDSVYERLLEIEQHVHSAAKCYPTLAAGVTVTGGAGAWQLGNYVEIVPASTITSKFDIHWINVGSASASDTYELVLYAATTEIGRVRFTRPSGSTTNSFAPFMCDLVAANTQIQAKIASSSGGGDTAVISIGYHTYTH